VTEEHDELNRLRRRLEHDDELIQRLHDEAGVRDAELAEVQSRLAASELELEDLRAVRDALTPAALPARPGLAIEVSFLPATQRVSGDFYLAAPGPADTTMVVVGDVVGKGIEAARDAAFLRAAFATIARFSDDPCRLLRWASAAFGERGRFATAACLTYDPGSRCLRLGLAGHPAPLRLATGDELSIGRRGAPLGLGEPFNCRDADFELQSGDGVLIYTDGLTEARRDGELFGPERAQAIVRAMPDQPAADVLARLRDEATEFCGGRLADDLCLLALQGV
jgi:serine phosphatase RsbU (regulator of sigma subunit)